MPRTSRKSETSNPHNSREELAQSLIDAAVTPEGIEDAREGIRELVLDPANFTSKF